MAVITLAHPRTILLRLERGRVSVKFRKCLIWAMVQTMPAELIRFQDSACSVFETTPKWWPMVPERWGIIFGGPEHNRTFLKHVYDMSRTSLAT